MTSTICYARLLRTSNLPGCSPSSQHHSNLTMALASNYRPLSGISRMTRSNKSPLISLYSNRSASGVQFLCQPKLARTASSLFMVAWDKRCFAQSCITPQDVFRLCGSGHPRWLATSSTVRHKTDSVETSEQSPSVTSWEAVKKKEQQIREAGQDLLDDLKEKKAKVREKVDAVIQRENIWTVPNLLCVSRIVLSPVLAQLVVAQDYHLALAVFMLAGFTDLLDGWIARTFPSQASHLGSFLDPLADKVLVALLFLSLTYMGLIPLPLTGLIIYRDVLIIGGASYVRYRSLPPPRTITRYFDATHATAKLAPTAISKFNTVVQLGLITASLAAPVFCFTDHYLLKTLWWLTAATTLSSGLSYIFSRDTYKFLSTMNKPPQDS